MRGRDWLGYERLQSPAVARSTLAAVHPEAHIDAIERAVRRPAAAQIDADTVVSEGSFEAALHAAGGAVELVDLLLGGGGAVRLQRPPPARPPRRTGAGDGLLPVQQRRRRGAARARPRTGCERVMILDWDVHHGNGTNDIFRDEPGVLFVSIHQSPLYPGTGPAGDVGVGRRRSATRSTSRSRPGSGDETSCSLVDRVAVPLAT